MTDEELLARHLKTPWMCDPLTSEEVAKNDTNGDNTVFWVLRGRGRKRDRRISFYEFSRWLQTSFKELVIKKDYNKITIDDSGITMSISDTSLLMINDSGVEYKSKGQVIWSCGPETKTKSLVAETINVIQELVCNGIFKCLGDASFENFSVNGKFVHNGSESRFRNPHFIGNAICDNRFETNLIKFKSLTSDMIIDCSQDSDVIVSELEEVKDYYKDGGVFFVYVSSMSKIRCNLDDAQFIRPRNYALLPFYKLTVGKQVVPIFQATYESDKDI